MLEFLGNTRVGCISAKRTPQQEMRERTRAMAEKRAGQVRQVCNPLTFCFLFGEEGTGCFSFPLFIRLFIYTFPLSGGFGEKAIGAPCWDRSFRSGTGYGHGKSAAVRKGSGKPLPWPFGSHVAVNK